MQQGVKWTMTKLLNILSRRTSKVIMWVYLTGGNKIYICKYRTMKHNKIHIPLQACYKTKTYPHISYNPNIACQFSDAPPFSDQLVVLPVLFNRKEKAEPDSGITVLAAYAPTTMRSPCTVTVWPASRERI